METSQQLLNDSFSYGWLINVESSGSLDDGGSFIEIDPDFISMRWTIDFDFHLPTSQCSVQAHADQIFSNGHLLPLCVPSPPESGALCTTSALSKSQSVNSNRYQSPRFCTVPSRASTSANSSPLFHSAKSSPNCMSSWSPNSPVSRSGKFNSHFVRDCAKSPKKILCKYFCFLMPFYKMVKDFRLASSKSVSSCKDSATSSPRSSNALSSIDWCRSNADISIYDAILHCKKSIGQDN